MFTRQVTDHYENPRNIGSIADADGTATVGSAASGEMLKLTLNLANPCDCCGKIPSIRMPNRHCERLHLNRIEYRALDFGCSENHGG